MKPILFDKSATVFSSNGLGRLSDSKTCSVTEERNGIYELEMEYPITGIHYTEIQHSMIVVAKPFQNGTLQGFRIYKISKPMKGLIKIYARHISNQLNFIPCRVFSGSNCAEALANFKTAAVTDCPFTFETDIVSQSYDPSTLAQWEVDFYAAVEVKRRENPGAFTYTDITDPNWKPYKEMLVYFMGADYKYPIKMSPSKTVMKKVNETTDEKIEEQLIPVIKAHYDQYTWTLPEPAMIKTYLGGKENSILDVYGGEYEWDNYRVFLHNARGSNKGVTLRYGKNLTDLTQEENIENTVTGIYPIYKTDSITVTLSSPVYPSPDTVSADFPFKRIEIKDFTSEFENVPTTTELREFTEDYIKRNKIGIPSVNLKVNFVNLSDLQEYQNLQSVNLCDTITVYFPDLGVNAKEKVTKTVYDVLSERYTSIEIGTVSESLARKLESELTKGATKEDLANSEKVTSEIINKVTGYMNEGRNGYVIINRNDQGWANEILFLDSGSNGDVNRAVRMIRINSNGIAFGEPVYETIDGQKYRTGAWNFSQSWLMDGTLSLGGINNQNGTFRMLDSNAEVIGQWDNAGLHVYGGIIESGQFKTKGGEVSIMEDDEGKVEIEFPGCFFVYEGGGEDEEYKLIGHTQGNVENPAVGNDIKAGINWTTGEAGFYNVYLCNPTTAESDFPAVSDGSLRDILHNIDDRLEWLETHGGGGGGDDDNSPCDGGDCDEPYLPDGDIEPC